jgi:hypothetical protein
MRARNMGLLKAIQERRQRETSIEWTAARSYQRRLAELDEKYGYVPPDELEPAAERTDITSRWIQRSKKPYGPQERHFCHFMQ